MQIICNRSFHFQQHEILENTKTGEKVAIVKQEFRVYPSYQPQVVPDWIEDEALFELALEDNSIQVIQIISEPKTKTKTIVEHIEQMGWGAKPTGNKGVGLKTTSA
jgi:hypothetical protein